MSHSAAIDASTPVRLAEAEKGLEFYACSEGCEADAYPIRKYDGGVNCGSKAKGLAAKIRRATQTGEDEMSNGNMKAAVERAPALLGIKDVAERLHKTERWLKDFLRERPFGRKAGRTWLFTEADLFAIIRKSND